VEVFLSVQEGGKLLKLATVVAVPENVSVLLLPWILSPWNLCFRNCSLFILEQAFLCPYKLRDSASPARWAGLKYVFFFRGVCIPEIHWDSECIRLCPSVVFRSAVFVDDLDW